MVNIHWAHAPECMAEKFAVADAFVAATPTDTADRQALARYTPPPGWQRWASISP